MEEITQWGNISVVEPDAWMFHLELGKNIIDLGQLQLWSLLALRPLAVWKDSPVI
jgi:hypothetical protein